MRDGDDMEPPELERLKHNTDEVLDASGSLANYVQPEAESPGEVPFLRDDPYADAGFVGGETPFFTATDAGDRFDFEMDETEGIPTGLPDLLDLENVSAAAIPLAEKGPVPFAQPIAPPVPRGRAPMSLPPIEGYVSEKKLLNERRMAFSVGVLVASVLWGILLAVFAFAL